MILHPLTMPRVGLSSAMARHKNINSLIDMRCGQIRGTLLEAANFQIYPTKTRKFYPTISKHICDNFRSFLLLVHGTISFFLLFQTCKYRTRTCYFLLKPQKRNITYVVVCKAKIKSTAACNLYVHRK